MISLFTDCGWARLKKVEDKMFENLYNLLLNYAGEIEKGLTLAVGDSNLGIEKKVKPKVEPAIYDVQRIKNGRSPIWKGRR